VLIQTGGLAMIWFGHWRSWMQTAGKGEYFAVGCFNMALLLIAYCAMLVMVARNVLAFYGRRMR
jgi:hypothetical protein